MQITTPMAPPLSSASIALNVLRSEAGTQTNISARPTMAKDDMAADSVAYRAKLDQLWRIIAGNTHCVVLEQFHLDYATSAQYGIALRDQAHAMERAEPQPLASFGESDAAKFRALGANAAILVPQIVMNSPEMHALTTKHIETTYQNQPGFAAALVAGQVKIQRTSEMPEFNFGHKSYALFRDGYMIGGALWGQPFNQALYDKIDASGTAQGFGGLMGQDYYVTWPKAGGP